MGWRRSCAATTAPVVAAVAMFGGIGAGVATAESGLTMVPLQTQIRHCDFVPSEHLIGYGSGTGSGFVDVGAEDSGTVRAEVHLQTAAPATAYQVRLIQLPRSSYGTCAAGDPGVATGSMYTDAVGSASTTVTGPRMQGATGAYVVIEGPPAPGKLVPETYSSTFVVGV
jgi:hypothetical protein